MPAKKTAKAKSSSATKPASDTKSTSEPLFEVAQSFELNFSPDSQFVAASVGGKIFHVRSGQEQLKCKVPTGAMGLQFSPKGDCLASSGYGVLTILSANTGAVVHKIKDVGGELAFDPNGTWIATADDQGLALWETATGKLAQRVSLAERFAWGIGWFPGSTLWVHVSESDPKVKGGEAAVLLTFDGKLKCSEVKLGRVAEKIVPHPKRKNGVVAADPKALLICDGPKVVREAKLKLNFIKALKISPDGKWIAIVAGGASQDKFLLFAEKDLTVRAERELAAGTSTSFSPDSTLVAIATEKKGEIWEIERLIAGG